MDKNAIKKYAVWARRELISRVSGRAAWYGITEDSCVDAEADNIDGRVLSATEKKQRAAFISKVQHEGYEQAIEEIAYTWFNRFCALRYMEVNGYLPSHIRVFTDDANEFKPQILDEAIHLEIEGLDKEKVLTYKDTNDTEGLYRYLLITQCNALSSILPGMFQKIEDYTELLLPENLLREGSVIERMIAEIPEEDWTDQVQIIGWLYQYYNAEKKDEVFAALKKNVKITKENIPAATQLFTPDWIVRYMVENSLGRLWFEGHPNSELKSSWKYYMDEAKQEPEVEEQLAEIRNENAALKPENIKCIDPCCGSGHILVYMFDVLMQIYKSYGYTTSEAVISIVANNLYGLDIDERAVQLAYFAVMMKARSYNSRFFDQGIQPNVHAICESNNLSKKWLTVHEQTENLFDCMKDAKEYGSLIETPSLDYAALRNAAKSQFQGIDQLDFDVDELQNQLPVFLSLIDVAAILSQQYNVVVTNPPYMGASNMNPKLRNYIKQNYSDYKSDFFSAFIVRCKKMGKQEGHLGFFSPYVWMFIQSYEKLRILLYSQGTIETLIQFEYSAFEEATVPVCTFTIRNKKVEDEKGCYLRLTDFRGGMEIQREKTLEAIANHKCGFYFEQCTENFSKIPGSPLAYWTSKTVLNIFKKDFPLSKYIDGKVGLQTGNNNLFLRFWFELRYIDISFNSDKSFKWFPYNKGGEFRRWYGNNIYVVNWGNNGNSIKNYKDSKGKLLSRPQNTEFYFKPGITWSSTSSGDFSCRYCFGNFLFDSKGCMAFSYENDQDFEFYILAAMNTKCNNEFLKVITPTIDYNPGPVCSAPIEITKEKSIFKQVVNIAKQNISFSESEWNSFETSWDFQCHPLVRWGGKFLDATPSSVATNYYRYLLKVKSPLELSFLLWQDECAGRFEKLKANEEKLNHIFIDMYGLQDELTPEVYEKDVTVRQADLHRDIKSLISYAVGCMFGRYSLDVYGLVYAGGEWDDSKYQTYQPDYNGILPICDDEYFTDDIVGHFVDFIRVVYGEENLEENLQFIADALGGNGSSRKIIRKYFLNDFFADHCKVYQKRPIYWLFDSGKMNGFKCLIYMHRYSSDTIARIRTDYVHEQQARYRTAIADLENRIETAPTSDRIKLNKELKKIQEQADELHDYEEKIHHLADQYIDLDLDDGVKVNYAKFQDVLAKIK